MADKVPDPTPEPRIQDRRMIPPGVVPKNAQAWVISGIALVMVVIIALSGRNPSKDRRATAAAQAPTVVDPNAARIQEYENGIEATTRRLKLQQDQLARTQQALSPPPLGGAGSSPYSLPGTTPAPYLRPDMQEASPDDNWIQTDKRKREYQSLFASNMVLTYRPEARPTIPPALPGGSSGPSATSPYPTPAPGTEPAGSPTSAIAPAAAAAGRREQPADENNSRKSRGPDRDAELNRAGGKLYRVFEGVVLETVLTNRLDGDFSGPVNCMVTTNVYSHDGQRLLIPQGTRVLGEVRRVETFGEQRLAVFHRLIMPDGYSVSLDKFQGLNQVGETGLQDLVNHHYAQIFGASIAIGALAGLAQANTSYGLNESASDAYRQGVASSLSQSSMHILDRYLNVLPTFTIREGHRVKVYLSGDLLLPAYEKHLMPSDL